MDAGTEVEITELAMHFEFIHINHVREIVTLGFGKHWVLKNKNTWKSIMKAQTDENAKGNKV